VNLTAKIDPPPIPTKCHQTSNIPLLSVVPADPLAFSDGTKNDEIADALC
jgi:hypothetical protein